MSSFTYNGELYNSASGSSFPWGSEAHKPAMHSFDRMNSRTGRSNLDQLEKPPGWWNALDPGRFHIWSWILRALCFVSLISMEQLWDSMGDEERWETHRKRAVNRMSNVNIAAGLVLTTSAVFISSQPPMASFVPYTMHACYVLSLGSFAHALGGLLSGLAVVNIYDVCDRTWARNVFTATRFRLCCALIFLSWANLSLSLSILLLMTSLLIACYASGVLWLQLLATLEILSWAWLLPLFAWCASEKTLQGDFGISMRRIVPRLFPAGVRDHEGRGDSMV